MINCMPKLRVSRNRIICSETADVLVLIGQHATGAPQLNRQTGIHTYTDTTNRTVTDASTTQGQLTPQPNVESSTDKRFMSTCAPLSDQSEYMAASQSQGHTMVFAKMRKKNDDGSAFTRQQSIDLGLKWREVGVRVGLSG